MAHPPFGVRGSHPLIASFQRAYPPFHDLRHVVVPLQDHETTPFKEVNLRVSRQYGRFGPAAGFLGIREFVQNCLDQAGRQAVGGVRDVQCEILKANLDTLYGFYSVRGDSLISHGHVLQVASPTKRGSFDYEICNYSTLRVTERSLDVGSSDKSGKDTIGCYGDGLLTSIALLTKKDVPVVLDTFNCRWSFTFKPPAAVEAASHVDPDDIDRLHLRSTAYATVGHDFYVRVYGVRSGLAPEDYLLVKLPERTFGNGDLQILTGAHVAGRVYVKGIFVAQAEELLQIGINYQGAADTYANLGFSRDRNHLKLKRLGGVLSVLKSLDEGSQRELAEVLLEEFMAMERDDVNHPFFQKTSEQLANYLFAAFRRVYPDALPSYKTLQHDGVDFGLVNKLLGTRPVDIGPRLYNLLALSEGFKEVGEYMEIYYQALVDLPASELRDLTYEESLGAFAGLCMGLPRKRILFKKFPAGCTKRILTIPRGSRAACKYLRTPSDLEPADELEEEPPLEAGSEDGDVQPHNCLLVADIEEYSFARVHKGGHHRDQSPAEEGDVCNCGPLKFALDVAGCLEMSMDGLLSHLTRGVTTGMLGVSKAKGKPTAEARQRDAERKARAQAELRELRAIHQQHATGASRVDPVESSRAYLEDGSTRSRKRKAVIEERAMACLEQGTAKRAANQHSLCSVAASKAIEPLTEGSLCCNLPPLVLVGKLANGVGVYRDFDAGRPSTPEDAIELGVERFMESALRITRLFELPNSAVKVFWSPSAQVQAFNKDGFFYLNAGKETAGDFDYCAWFVTICHELAHSDSRGHGLTHEQSEEALIRSFLPQIASLILRSSTS